MQRQPGRAGEAAGDRAWAAASAESTGTRKATSSGTTRTVAEGAAAVIALATIPDDGPSGEFHNDRGVVPW